MEPLSLIPVTFASILTFFGTTGTPYEEAVINTHTRPEISGLWEVIPEIEEGLEDKKGIDTISDAVEATEVSVTELYHRLEDNYHTNDLGDKRRAISRVVQNFRDANYKDANGDTAKDRSSTPSVSDALLVKNMQPTLDPMCRVRYNFASDNVMIHTSGDKWVYGEYLYQQQHEDLSLMVISTTYDNKKSNCFGDNEDSTGSTDIIYVHYKPRKNEMVWCSNKTGENCFQTLYRLQP